MHMRDYLIHDDVYDEKGMEFSATYILWPDPINLYASIESQIPLICMLA